MSLCIYAFHLATIKIGRIIANDIMPVVAKSTLFKTVGIVMTSHRVIASAMVTTIAVIMMITVETNMTTNMVMARVKVETNQV
jgi:hypothetical protein